MIHNCLWALEALVNTGHVREDFPKAKYKDCYQDTGIKNGIYLFIILVQK